ncbi:hypothetical protein ElyMa_007053800 [Elysia marginata]|uniref:Uncharacterized protein n=1 Tax=Elysia marginata TaxID=1093978 RepID=A0AAV4JVR5_9GAST|nr:hypothetical protein ElyMa_007053800 [Elysia marginata]
MSIIKQIIDNHNKKTLNKIIAGDTSTVNNKNVQLQKQNHMPTQRQRRPLSEYSLSSDRHTRKQNNKETNTSIRIAENPFKTKYSQHNSGFRLEHKQCAAQRRDTRKVPLLLSKSHSLYI